MPDPAIAVIGLWCTAGGLRVDDCPVCGRERPISHAVGWWCGPRPEAIGSTLPNGEEVGGMCVCVECHDELHAARAGWEALIECEEEREARELERKAPTRGKTPGYLPGKKVGVSSHGKTRGYFPRED